MRTSIERVRTNSRQAVGKDDSSQRRNIFECVWTDLIGPCRNHKLCHGTRWRHDDQRLPSLSLFEKAATIDEIVGVTWAESNRSKLWIPLKSRMLNRNKGCPEVNRRQCTGHKRIPTDGLHRIRYRHGGQTSALKCALTNLSESVEILTEINLGKITTELERVLIDTPSAS